MRHVAMLVAVVVTIGCGEITATMVPPAAAGPDGGGAIDVVAASDRGSVALADRGSGDADAGAAETPGTDVGGTEAAAPADVAPDHPALRCVGDYIPTVCKPGCGTCRMQGSASTFIEGCWTSDDFHCVSSCAECRGD